MCDDECALYFSRICTRRKKFTIVFLLLLSPTIAYMLPPSILVIAGEDGRLGFLRLTFPDGNELNEDPMCAMVVSVLVCHVCCLYATLQLTVKR